VESLIVTAPVCRIVDLLGPFDSPRWLGSRPFDAAEVRSAGAAGDLHPDPIGARDCVLMCQHVARIAWLAGEWVNDGTNAPQVEILQDGQLVINDGWHRLCAAAVRGDEMIHLDVSGFIDEAADLLGVPVAG